MNSVCQLGSLEKEIMDIMWHECPCSVRDVCTKIQANREVAYTTIMTVMGRLVEKGVLCREKKGKAHVYRVCTSRKDMARFEIDNFFSTLFECYESDGVLALQEEVSKLSKEKQEVLRNIFQK